jgi:ATP-binding cassette subfamily C (CFTR/MRP) protein 1
MDYDRVMVLERGELMEFDSPKALMTNPDGMFYSMVKDTGAQNLEAFLSL